MQRVLQKINCQEIAKQLQMWKGQSLKEELTKGNRKEVFKIVLTPSLTPLKRMVSLEGLIKLQSVLIICNIQLTVLEIISTKHPQLHMKSRLLTDMILHL